MSDSSPASARPRQVTVATWVGGAVSVAMLLAVGEMVVKLRTVDGRQGIADFLARQGDTAVRMSLDQAVTVARVGLLVCGATAAAMAVLAFFAARRDRSARVGMTVVAVPLLVTGLFVDPFMAAFVVVSAVLLWTGPASDWYAGRAVRGATPAEPPSPQQLTQQLTQPLPPPVGPGDAPAPYAGGAAPYGVAPFSPVAPTRAGRPGRVVAAVVITWAMSAIVVLLMVLVAITALDDGARDTLTKLLADNQQARESGITVHQLVVAMSAVAAVLALWAVGAMVLAALVLRGHDWARIMLAISAGVAGAASLVGVLANPGFLLVVLACASVLALLLHRDTNQWFAARRRPVAPQPPRVRPPSPPW